MKRHSKRLIPVILQPAAHTSSEVTFSREIGWRGAQRKRKSGESDSSGGIAGELCARPHAHTQARIQQGQVTREFVLHVASATRCCCEVALHDNFTVKHKGSLGPPGMRDWHTRLPTRRTGFNTRPGHRIFASGNRAGRCRWSAGFLGVLPFPPPLHSRALPYSSHFTLINSQDLDVKSRSNLFTHFTYSRTTGVSDILKNCHLGRDHWVQSAEMLEWLTKIRTRIKILTRVYIDDAFVSGIERERRVGGREERDGWLKLNKKPRHNGSKRVLMRRRNRSWWHGASSSPEMEIITGEGRLDS
ncbi:hypothetical protein PR048_024700 [Dryococelus australis]|uniref:Uncharacterized protein n=1 Tax=Dryococelus australis TaxID=614101 RepID=A0ABQ9GPD2_9NEOP|nr:hypothetical protein PR048_024700 [Dryococelus australis]